MSLFKGREITFKIGMCHTLMFFPLQTVIFILKGYRKPYSLSCRHRRTARIILEFLEGKEVTNPQKEQKDIIFFRYISSIWLAGQILNKRKHSLTRFISKELVYIDDVFH